MKTEFQKVVEQMAYLTMQGAEVIMAEHGVSEEQAIMTALIYGCEWLTENKPELTANWIQILKAGV